MIENIDHELEIFKNELELIKSKGEVDNQRLENLSYKCQQEIERLNGKIQDLEYRLEREISSGKFLFESIKNNVESIKREYDNNIYKIEGAKSDIDSYKQKGYQELKRLNSKFLEKVDLLYTEYRRAYLGYFKNPMDRNKFRLR